MDRSHALLLTAPRTLVWQAQPLPPLQKDEVLVRTRFSAVSLGTEVPLFMGSSRNPAHVTYPKMTGYETYGVVEAVGEAVGDFHVGDPVVTFEGYVTHAVLGAPRLIPVPKDIDPRLALLAILSNDVKRGVLKVAPQPGERVLVTGAGAIGLLTLFVLKALGTIHITIHIDVVDPLRARLELAHQLGATNVFTPEEVRGAQTSYTVGLECSSRNAAFALLQNKLRANGRICILADGNLEPLELTPHFHQKELRVVGSSDGEDYREHARWFFGLPNLFKLTALFDLEVDAADLPGTFEHIVRGELRPVKVLVRYGEFHEQTDLMKKRRIVGS